MTLFSSFCVCGNYKQAYSDNYPRTLLVLFAGLELGEQEGDAHGEEEDHHTHHVHEDSFAVLLAVVATVTIEQKIQVMLGNKGTIY